ncbi:DedD protein [Tamilnaduibacter salinus]|uniref:DedD protein n=1 Tax=Tamilnaduibacter salinus TaxID=1484056 RepID=A0A2U1CZL3_9GAMM|nr:DedD protein [Tamilnaduibacter salinus]
MDGLKQRVVGALVLISLAVIFVPMLFDEPRQERTTQAVDIPEEPDFPEVSQPGDSSDTANTTSSAKEPPDFKLEERPAKEALPETPESGDDGEPASGEPASETVAASENVAGTSDTDSVDSPDSEGGAAGPESSAQQASASASEFSEVLEGGWLVQLGSFGNRGNATGMRDRIREAGYDAHLQQIERGGTTLTRVFSGPFASEAMAKEAKQSLDEAFSVNSLVIQGDQ